MIIQRFAGAGPLLAALLLSGCSGEPGNGDMLKALKNDFSFRVSLEAQVMGDSMATGARHPNPQQAVTMLAENATLKKSSCKEAQGVPGYVCDFQVEVPFASGAKTLAAKGRFFKNGNDWAFETLR